MCSNSVESTRTMCQTILKVNNKDTRTTSSVSIVNFKYVSHFILLVLLNLNKGMLVGSEKW